MITIDQRSFIPIYEQVKTEIKKMVALGALRPHESLPSIRDLAGRLVINPNTVARAYRDLERDGFIYTQKGRGCFVADRGSGPPARERVDHLNRVFDLAIEEARLFGLGTPEILGLVERRLGVSEDGDGSEK